MSVSLFLSCNEFLFLSRSFRSAMVSIGVGIFAVFACLCRQHSVFYIAVVGSSSLSYWLCSGTSMGWSSSGTLI